MPGLSCCGAGGAEPPSVPPSARGGHGRGLRQPGDTQEHPGHQHKASQVPGQPSGMVFLGEPPDRCVARLRPHPEAASEGANPPPAPWVPGAASTPRGAQNRFCLISGLGVRAAGARSKSRPAPQPSFPPPCPPGLVLWGGEARASPALLWGGGKLRQGARAGASAASRPPVGLQVGHQQPGSGGGSTCATPAESTQGARLGGHRGKRRL